MGAVLDVCCHKQTARFSHQSRPIISKASQNSARVKRRMSQSGLFYTETIGHSSLLPAFKTESKIDCPTPSPMKSKTERDSEQFYEIESCIEEREKSGLQPKKVSSDDFEVKGLLGQGAFCNVFLVQIKKETGSQAVPMAMKKIPKCKISSQKTKESIKLQRHILASGFTPFIAELRYAFIDKNFLYIVMQFASGGDANRFVINPVLRQQFLKIGPQAIRFIIGCVVLGLESLHYEGIVFRDMKPENILLFDNGYCKLSDFGLAKLLPDKDQRAKTLAGTAVYCSPEMILQVGYNRAVDFWSLGVLVYQLATGQTPFKLEDVSTKLRYKRVAQEEEVNRRWRGHQLAPAMTDFVGELLRFKPEERLGMKGWVQIKKHKYFHGFNWDELKDRTMISPLLQIIRQNPMQIKSFRKVPEECMQSLSDSISQLEDEWQFNGNVK